MRYLLLVYIDQTLLGAMPLADFDVEMKQCLEHADALKVAGSLMSFEQLEAPSTARSVRVRNGRTTLRASEFGVGLLFGGGLLISGMTDPGKVLGFLDLAGAWDPSLAFVTGGAVAVGVLAFAAARKRTRNFFGGALHLPNADDIDKPLLIGALLFGAGWGLAGFCPGPAIVSMAAGEPKALLFVVAMLAGMGIFEVTDRLSRQPEARA